MSFNSSDPVPITIITGYLGSGKTTLLNHILTADHGLRIAVILNEFGEIAIDNELVMNVEEEIITMNNGCICCSTRDDLVTTLEELMIRREAFDRVIVETSGLAEPGPVVMTFLTHPDLEESFRVDGVVALADAANLEGQLARGSEARQQIAYADRVLLNKTDLVGENQLEYLEASIRSINHMAEVWRTSYADVRTDDVLDIGGFDIDRIDLSDRAGLHRHEPGVGSVSVVLEGGIDLDRFDRWHRDLLRDHHEDIYRMKGVLDLPDQPRRFIFQGVHSLYNWGYGRTWDAEKRLSRVVVIGRELDRLQLREQLEECRIG